jgi:2-(1,2-epoxy-1,2-dihydrophenyl)acetyl-CoA isomerase
MEFRHLLVRDADRIRRIILNRPERLNALNVRIGVELLQALEDVDRDPEARVVILTGAGRAFCAGDDLRGMDEPGVPVRRFDDPIKQYVQGEGRWPLIVARMRAMSKPVIAMVNGHAHGAGFNLALGCDLRVIADDATLAIPFSRRGIGTGTNLLQQFVGIGKAMEWALLAPTLSAHEAERWGLVNRVAAQDQLEAATTELAQQLASGPTLVLGLTKAAWCRDGRCRPRPPTASKAWPFISRSAPRTSRRACRPLSKNARLSSQVASYIDSSTCAALKSVRWRETRTVPG